MVTQPPLSRRWSVWICQSLTYFYWLFIVFTESSQTSLHQLLSNIDILKNIIMPLSLLNIPHYKRLCPWISHKMMWSLPHWWLTGAYSHQGEIRVKDVTLIVTLKHSKPYLIEVKSWHEKGTWSIQIFITKLAHLKSPLNSVKKSSKIVNIITITNKAQN